MTGDQYLHYRRLIRVVPFLDELSLPGAPPVVRTCIAELRHSNDRVAAAAAEQYGADAKGSKDGVRIEKLKQQLRVEFMIPLSQSKRKYFRWIAGAERALRTPHAKASHGEVVEASERMLKFLTPHRRHLTSAGWAPDYLPEFRKRTREFRRITDSVSARQKRYARAARVIGDELESAAQNIKVLTALFRTLLKDRPSVLADWLRVSRLGKRLGRPRKKRGAQASGVTPTAVPVA